MMAVYRELTAMERARLMLRLWLLAGPLDPEVVRLMPAEQKAEYDRLTRRVEEANGNAAFHLSVWQHWLIELVAEAMGVSRNTVRRYLTSAEPRRVEEKARGRPVLEGVRKRMDELIAEWRERTTSKQRMTGTRLHRELVDEGHSVGVTLVRDYLREQRRRVAEVYIPLVHRPGDEVHLDFVEDVVEVEGERRTVWRFVMRLMYSGRDFAWLYERCDQLASLDGHVRA